MSALSIYLADSPVPHLQTSAAAQISDWLAPLGVVFRQFFTGHLDLDASQDEIIEAQRELLNDLMLAHDFAAIDVLNVSPGYSRLEKLLSDLQTEHSHPDNQARLFLAGRGRFYLRAETEIHALDCGPGDFVTLPAKLAHWFELDTSAAFCVVRLFAFAEGKKHSIASDSLTARRFEGRG